MRKPRAGESASYLTRPRGKPTKQRQALELVSPQSSAISEIAERLDMPLGTIKKQNRGDFIVMEKGSIHPPISSEKGALFLVAYT